MKPILFNQDMVRAILEGRKTVTRRVVKDKDIINAWDCEADGTPIAYIDRATGDCYEPTAPCLYNSGDTLYVRETWAHPSEAEIANGADPNMYLYKADMVQPAAWDKWRPSIHMPREAARIFLRVTSVSVERLQDITEEQAELEGCRKWYEGTKLESPARSEFSNVWDSTTKKADRALYGWEASPWVWVIEFERISKEEAMKC